MNNKIIFSLAIVAATSLNASVAAAGVAFSKPPTVQPVSKPVDSSPPGTKVETINAFRFTPYSSSDTNGAIGTSRFATGGTGLMEAAVDLPNGATVFGLEIAGCDTSGGDISATLNECAVDECSTMLAVASADTPGCGFFRIIDSTAKSAINNRANSYVVEVQSGPDGGARFSSVRIFYRLNVSPAPAVAAFSDVPPTSTFFRYVEALRAAGLTNGCAPGMYCPDSPVTRAELAKYLSTGLGLSW